MTAEDRTKGSIARVFDNAGVLLLLCSLGKINHDWVEEKPIEPFNYRMHGFKINYRNIWRDLIFEGSLYI